MSLTVKVTCDQCGTSHEGKLATPHFCRRLTPAGVDALIEKFLDDLGRRSGFELDPMLREMIRADWRTLAQHVLRTLPDSTRSG